MFKYTIDVLNSETDPNTVVCLRPRSSVGELAGVVLGLQNGIFSEKVTGFFKFHPLKDWGISSIELNQMAPLAIVRTEVIPTWEIWTAGYPNTPVGTISATRLGYGVEAPTLVEAVVKFLNDATLRSHTWNDGSCTVGNIRYFSNQEAAMKARPLMDVGL